MGQKVHPYGFRVGTLYGWQSNWFAGKQYAKQLHEDVQIRAFIKKKLYHAGISKVVIERTGDKVVINIHTARPGILIGKRGAEVDVLRKDLKAFTTHEVFINIKEIRKAELDACPDEESRLRRLSQLNVLQQVGNLSRTPVVLNAWSRGRRPVLHGWVYDIGTGLVERVVEEVDGAEKAARLLPAN